jgi:transposase InsO family protein
VPVEEHLHRLAAELLGEATPLGNGTDTGLRCLLGHHRTPFRMPILSTRTVRQTGSTSFFASLKKERVHHERYPTFEAARVPLFESIEVFDNRQRRHSALDYRSPAEFEVSEFS